MQGVKAGSLVELRSHMQHDTAKIRKLNSSYDPVIPLLGISGEKYNSERYMHPSVHSTTIYNG